MRIFRKHLHSQKHDLIDGAGVFHKNQVVGIQRNSAMYFRTVKHVLTYVDNASIFMVRFLNEIFGYFSLNIATLWAKRHEIVDYKKRCFSRITRNSVYIIVEIDR